MAPVVLVVEESDALIVSPKFSGPRIEGFQVRLELRSTTVDRASRGPLRSESIHASTKEIVFAELEPGAYVLRLDVASREVVHSGLSWIMGVYHHIQTKERPSEAAS